MDVKTQRVWDVFITSIRLISMVRAPDHYRTSTYVDYFKGSSFSMYSDKMPAI